MMSAATHSSLILNENNFCATTHIDYLCSLQCLLLSGGLQP